MIRVFLVEDHPVVREGLIRILQQEGDLEVIGSALLAEEALSLLPRADPDVIVLDYRLPDATGDEVCREIARLRLRGQVVVLSAYIEDEVVRACLFAGARGYVVKDVAPTVLIEAIRSAARGETTIDPKVAGKVVGWAAATRQAAGASLRPVEVRVLRLLCEGKSNGEIASHVGISINTVKAYLKKVYRMLGVAGRAEAVAVALRKGLV